MIAHLEGRVLERVGDTELVVTAGGVGYRVMADARGTDVADEVTLWVHSITGDTGTKLYGFETQAERDLFVDLLSAKGVGGKTAFAVVSRGVGLVRDALHRCDAAALIGKGCGEKAAQAIIAKLGAKPGTNRGAA